jgi:hypothetical protein
LIHVCKNPLFHAGRFIKLYQTLWSFCLFLLAPEFSLFLMFPLGLFSCRTVSDTVSDHVRKVLSRAQERRGPTVPTVPIVYGGDSHNAWAGDGCATVTGRRDGDKETGSNRSPMVRAEVLQYGKQFDNFKAKVKRSELILHSENSVNSCLVLSSFCCNLFVVYLDACGSLSPRRPSEKRRWQGCRGWFWRHVSDQPRSREAALVIWVTVPIWIGVDTHCWSVFKPGSHAFTMLSASSDTIFRFLSYPKVEHCQGR